MNYDLGDIKEVLQFPPSYLLDFFPYRREEKILLAHLNKTNENVSSPKTVSPLEETENGNSTTITTLDVTGSPLKVDLKGDETLILEKDVIIQQWSENENKHFPILIDKARQYLNSKTNIKNREAVFVVTDGYNTLKTVILGVQESSTKIFTCTINILGFLTLSDEKLSFLSMERSHNMLVGTKSCKINYLTTFKYFIFGAFMQNVKKDCKYNGSVCVQTSMSAKCDLNKPSNLIKEVQLFLQVMAGHRESAVYFLWKELCLLQSYINIGETTEIVADAIISNNPKNMSNIYQCLDEIISSNLILKEPKSNFDLENIRMHNISDKLWDILKYCENLEVLRLTFHYFFEGLAESNSYNKVPPGNGSNVATIINGIIDGKLAVPTISHTQALEFLFELGAEKLKNDYQTISKHFYAPSYPDIADKWNLLQKKLTVEGAVRKTRLTQCLKSDKINMKACIAKLSYLGKLHVATEMIYLIEQKAYLPEDTFDFFCAKVFEKYVAKDNFNFEFKDIQDTPLCEFDVAIRINANDIVAAKLPDFCSVRLKSVIDNLEAETVFVLSKYKIIPPAIYDDFDVETADEEMRYYGYKMQSHNETA